MTGGRPAEEVARVREMAVERPARPAPTIRTRRGGREEAGGCLFIAYIGGCGRFVDEWLSVRKGMAVAAPSCRAMLRRSC